MEYQKKKEKKNSEKGVTEEGEAKKQPATQLAYVKRQANFKQIQNQKKIKKKACFRFFENKRKKQK